MGGAHRKACACRTQTLSQSRQKSRLIMHHAAGPAGSSEISHIWVTTSSAQAALLRDYGLIKKIRPFWNHKIQGFFFSYPTSVAHLGAFTDKTQTGSYQAHAGSVGFDHITT